MTVSELPDRLGPLRAAEAAFIEARMILANARADYGPAADAYLAFQRADAVAQATNTELDVTDFDISGGIRAQQAIETTYLPFRYAYHRLLTTISGMVGDCTFVIGDVVLSPAWPDAPLTVAHIFTPEVERQLGEVTLTADGGPIEKRPHNWPLTTDGPRVVPVVVDAEMIRYERWWIEGLRVAGTVHAVTRRLTSTD